MPLLLLVWSLWFTGSQMADVPNPAPASTTAVHRAFIRDTVRGVVFDSLTGEPLSDAFVIAEPSGELTTTQRDGRFVLTSSDKVTRVTAYHDVIEQLGLTGLVLERPESPVGWRNVVLSTPSIETIWARLCPGVRRPRNGMGGIVYGSARASDNKTRISGAGITVQWEEVGTVTDTARRYDAMRVRTDSIGDYVACGVQEFGDAAVMATSDRYRSGAVVATASVRPLRRVDLVLGEIAEGDVVSRALVRGRVVDASGAGVADATVEIEGADSTARTNANGYFVAANVPTGSRMVATRKVGYLVEFRSIDVMESGLVDLVIPIERGVMLTGVNVTERRTLSPFRAELESRLRSGYGKVVDSTFLTQSRAVRNALASLPGFQVQGQRDNEFTVHGRFGCAVDVYVDGILDSKMLPMYPMLPRDEIAVIEAFPSRNLAPGRYQTMSAAYDCGVLLFWTKSWLKQNR